MGRHLTGFYHVNTLIQPLRVRVRRKQIYFKLKVLKLKEMSAFPCLMFLAVFSVLIISFSPRSRAWFFFSSRSCQLPAVSDSFSPWCRDTLRAQADKATAQSVCHSGWLCSWTSRKLSATEVNYRLWNDCVVCVQQKIHPRHIQGLLVWKKLDDSDMKRESLAKEILPRSVE